MTLRALLPQVELSTLDGQLTEVQNLTSGKVALLALWAPWCEACAAELGALERLHDSAGPRGAIVIAIAVGEPRSKIAEFVATRALRFPQLVDEQFHLADALGQRRVPATLILDRSGRVTYAGGALDGAALSALRAALEPRALAQN
ncbi:MAG: TlpA family protein disulfide reductase [Polyangiales bacterium]